MTLVRFISIILASVLIAHFAWAADFQISAPQAWKKAEAPFNGEIYQNTKSKSGEAVVAFVYAIGASSRFGPDELMSLSKEISSLRNESFARLGLGNYTVLSSSKQTLKNQKAYALVTIESRYLDSKKHVVQAVERQYFTRDKIYQVLYVSEESNLRDHEKARAILDTFKPIYQGDRAPASLEVLNSSDSSTQRCADCESNVKPPPPIKGATADVCSEVPETKRRKNFSGSIGIEEFERFYETGVGCFKSLDWVLDLARTIVQIAPYTSPVSAAMKAYPAIRAYVEDPAYRVEVNASAFAALEAVKHPKEFGKRAVFAIASAVSETVKSFPCLNTEEQARVICSVLQAVGATAKGGYSIAKMALRSSLTSIEGESVAAASRAAMTAEVRGAGEAKAVGSAEEDLTIEPRPSSKAIAAAPLKDEDHYGAIQNQAQRKFLERVGIEFEGGSMKTSDMRQVAGNYNKILKDKIASGEIKEGDALWWSDTYVGQDGKLVFVHLGAPPPAGAKFFDTSQFKILGKAQDGRTLFGPLDGDVADATTLLASADYYAAIKSGHFPGSLAEEHATFQRSGHEALFFHELAHVGGFVDHPEGMGAFKKAVTEALEKHDGFVPFKTDKKIFYVNELLPTLKPDSIKDLRQIVPWSSRLSDRIPFVKSPAEKVASLSDSQLQDLAEKVSKWYDGARAPFGGALRTGAFSKVAGSQLDKMEEALMASRQELGAQSAKLDTNYLSGPQFDRTRRLSQIHRSIEAERKSLRENLVKFVSAADDLSKTNISDWFKFAAQDEPLKPNTPYYRFVCAEEFAHAQDFCK